MSNAKADTAVQVDGFSARIKPEPKEVDEEEEEGIGDVDLFALNPDRQQLTVNAKWLQHLQAGSPARSAEPAFPRLWCLAPCSRQQTLGKTTARPPPVQQQSPLSQPQQTPGKPTARPPPVQQQHPHLQTHKGLVAGYNSVGGALERCQAWSRKSFLHSSLSPFVLSSLFFHLAAHIHCPYPCSPYQNEQSRVCEGALSTERLPNQAYSVWQAALSATKRG